MRRPNAAIACLTVLALTATAAAQEASIDALSSRCHAGDTAACALAGARYQLGRGTPQSYERAGELYTRGCDGGLVVACGLLGGLYAEGHGVVRDDARAVQLFRRACEGRHELSCGQLGLMMTAGRGTARDVFGAAPYLERGCAASHNGACEVYGRMLLRGVGVARDPVRGQSLLQRACAGGSQSACAADTGGTEFAAPPPVVNPATTYDAPPPVVGSAPTYAAPPPVVVAPAPQPRVQPAPAPPPRTTYPEPRARPVYYRPPLREVASAPSSSSSSTVALLGGDVRASMFFLGYEVTPYSTETAGSAGFFGLGFRLARGPIEFAVDGRYGGGTLAPSVAPNAEWRAVVLGAGLGVNLLSWPRADRERFSLVNLSGGLNTSLALADTNGGDAFRLGGYVANTMHLLCWLGLRAEFTGSLVGEGTWGHSLNVSLYFGGRPRAQCN